MKLFSVLSAASLVATQATTEFRAQTEAVDSYLSTNKAIDHYTQWRPSQKSARNSVNYIFDLHFNTRDDGSFCSNGYTGNTCTERVCAYGLASSTSAFLTVGDAMHSPAAGGKYYGGGHTWGGTHSYTECSSQGVCDRLTGECQCFSGYQGKGCRRTTCPSDCSGHGTCLSNYEINNQYIGHRAGNEKYQSFNTQFWDHDKTMQCNCDRGFAGHDCSERICPHGDDVLTSCSEASNIDEQKITITNVVTAQQNEAPFLECGGSNTEARSGLDYISENGGTPFERAEFGGHFALLFSDSQGGSYITAPIAIQSQHTTPQSCSEPTIHTRTECIDGGNTWSGTDPADTSDIPTAAATAKAVQNALQNLPNFAIPSIQVTGTTTSTRVLSDLSYTEDNARFAAANAQADLGSGTCQVKNLELIVRFSDEATSGNQKLLEVRVADSSTDCQAGMQPRMPMNFFDIQADEGSEMTITIQDDVEDLMGGSHEENAECGNRGLCDTGTGKCNCFSGHTGEACGIQSNFV